MKDKKAIYNMLKWLFNQYKAVIHTNNIFLVYSFQEHQRILIISLSKNSKVVQNYLICSFLLCRND